MQSVLLFLIAIIAGYFISVYISKPIERNGKRRPNRLPTLRLGNMEILPCIRLHRKDKTYWLHHWIYISLLVIGILLVYDNFIYHSTGKAFTGASLGGIIQGLRYPDRFKFRHPRLK